MPSPTALIKPDLILMPRTNHNLPIQLPRSPLIRRPRLLTIRIRALRIMRHRHKTMTLTHDSRHFPEVEYFLAEPFGYVFAPAFVLLDADGAPS